MGNGHLHEENDGDGCDPQHDASPHGDASGNAPMRPIAL
jgi:hypothetical protein